MAMVAVLARGMLALPASLTHVSYTWPSSDIAGLPEVVSLDFQCGSRQWSAVLESLSGDRRQHRYPAQRIAAGTTGSAVQTFQRWPSGATERGFFCWMLNLGNSRAGDGLPSGMGASLDGKWRVKWVLRKLGGTSWDSCSWWGSPCQCQVQGLGPPCGKLLVRSRARTGSGAGAGAGGQQGQRSAPSPWPSLLPQPLTYSSSLADIDPVQLSDLWAKTLKEPPRDPRKVSKAMRHSFAFVVVRDESAYSSAGTQGRVVGVGRAVSDGSFIATIADVAVDPEYRGRGIGRKIVKRLVQDMKRRGPTGFAVFPPPTARRFFWMMGFRADKKYRIMAYQRERSFEGNDAASGKSALKLVEQLGVDAPAEYPLRVEDNVTEEEGLLDGRPAVIEPAETAPWSSS